MLLLLSKLTHVHFFKTRVREIKFMRKPIHTMYLELKISFFINLLHEKSKESFLILFKVIFLKNQKLIHRVKFILPRGILKKSIKNQRRIKNPVKH